MLAISEYPGVVWKLSGVFPKLIDVNAKSFGLEFWLEVGCDGSWVVLNWSFLAKSDTFAKYPTEVVVIVEGLAVPLVVSRRPEGWAKSTCVDLDLCVAGAAIARKFTSTLRPIVSSSLNRYNFIFSNSKLLRRRVSSANQPFFCTLLVI